MRKPLLYRFFGVGRLPEQMLPVLDQEAIVLKEEGLRGSAIFRNFRAPGRRYGYKRTWFIGSLVLTQQRVVAFSFRRPIINLPLGHEHFKALHCTLKDESTLCIAFDPGLFHEDWSGSVEYRFKTSRAGVFFEHLGESLA